MDKYRVVRIKSDKISLLIENKALIVLVSLLFISFLLFIVGLSVGSTIIHPLSVIEHLLGIGDGENTFVIEVLRLPRMLLAFLIGVSLAVSGLILQGLVRNPLASPDIIGITGGAKVAAVLCITFFSEVSVEWVPVAAIVGAGVAALVICLLAWKQGINPIRLVLIGIGLEAGMGAIVTMLIVLSPTYSTSEAYIWITGSVYGAKLKDVYAILPWVLIFVPVTIFFSRRINLLELGDDLAKGVGSRVQFNRIILILVSVALAGSAVAFAGGIGFVGLIAPHIARKLVGRSYGSLVPIGALIGGVTVMMADIVARTVFLPLDLPAGVFVAGMGAPFFIYLLYRNRNL